MKRPTLLQVARRRWGTARIVAGGLAARRRQRGRKRRPKAPGTATERKLVQRLLGKSLTRDELADAIRLLRAGARLKEIEINDRLESLFDE